MNTRNISIWTMSSKLEPHVEELNECRTRSQTGHAFEMSGDASAMNTNKRTKSELPIEEVRSAVGTVASSWTGTFMTSWHVDEKILGNELLGQS